MNRGDVKLMIDQLVCLDLSEADAEMVESVTARLEAFGNEYAKLQANLDRHMEVIVNGRKANETLQKKLGFAKEGLEFAADLIEPQQENWHKGGIRCSCPVCVALEVIGEGE